MNEDEEMNQDDQNEDSGNQTEDTQDAAPEEPENPVATEVDPYVDSGEQVALNSQNFQDNLQPDGDGGELHSSGSPITPMNLTLADGTDSGVALDSGVQYDALDPDGEFTFEFQKGNYAQIMDMPNKLSEKATSITRTVVPLIGAALIELVGNSDAFESESFNSTVAIQNGEPVFTCVATFKVELWLGNDIPKDAIMQDSQYVLNRIKVVPGCQFTKCEIDCNEGRLTVGFTL